MKTSVHELLDGCTAAELNDSLTNLSVDAPDDAAAQRIAAKALEKAGLQPKKRFGSRLLLVAALAVILAAALVGCYVADVVEYNRAAEFFDLNNLSTEGLDRSQIKRVYRDITTESFRYDKSAEVIADSADSRVVVDGADISITNTMNNNWAADNSGNSIFDPIPVEGVCYSYDTAAYPDSMFANSVAKYVDSEKVWAAQINDFQFRGAIPMGDRVFCYGYHDTSFFGGGAVQIKENEKCIDAVMLSDSDGKALWTLSCYGGEELPREIEAACLTPDGRIAAAGTGDLYSTFNYSNEPYPVTVSILDPDTGAVLGSVSAEVKGFCSVCRMACLSDGYLLEIQTYSDDTGYISEFIKIGADGGLLSRCRYDSADTTYRIEDMIAVDGRVFLSATARPVNSKLYEDVEIEQDDMTYDFGSYSDMWRDRARGEYSAVLLVIDSESGEPGQFWSVGGAFGGALGVDSGGCLTWQVGRIIAAGYSPYTNSFSLYGVTRRYDYTFDSAENLLRQERTDHIDGFRDH